MSWEAVSALATLASAIIVAIAAIAAVVQIRHLRAGNQLEAILQIYDRYNSREMTEARAYCVGELERRLADPATRAETLAGSLDPRVRLIGNSFNEIGGLVLDGFLDERLVLPLVGVAARLWRAIEPITLAMRENDRLLWADFEYVAALDQLKDRRRDAALRRFPPWFRSRFEKAPPPGDAVTPERSEA